MQGLAMERLPETERGMSRLAGGVSPDRAEAAPPSPDRVRLAHVEVDAVPAPSYAPPMPAPDQDRQRRINEHVRLAFLDGAEREWQRRHERPMTAAELSVC